DDEPCEPGAHPGVTDGDVEAPEHRVVEGDGGGHGQDVGEQGVHAGQPGDEVLEQVGDLEHRQPEQGNDGEVIHGFLPPWVVDPPVCLDLQARALVTPKVRLR